MASNKENLITPSEASRIAGISRQGMSSLKKRGSYNFFVQDGKKIKVDTNHPHWKNYLKEHGVNGESDSTIAEKQVMNNSKKKIGVNPAELKLVKNSKKGNDKKKPLIHTDEYKLRNEPNEQKNALTGGYDFNTFTPTSPQQLKALTEIQSRNIDMRIKLDELIDVEMVISIMQIVIRDIGAFVNLSRKVSGLICQKLDCVGAEKQVEAIIDPEIESIIKMLKKNMKKSIDIKSYIG